jgi:hypothetical protein
MPHSSRHRLSVLVVGVGLLFVAGCSRGVSVSGSVQLPEKMKLGDKDTLQILFVPAAKGQKTCSSQYSAESHTFVCNELTPGKYKIVVQVAPGPGTPTNQKDVIAFNGKFDPAKTKLKYDVTGSGDSIALDLAKETVTKQ